MDDILCTNCRNIDFSKVFSSAPPTWNDIPYPASGKNKTLPESGFITPLVKRDLQRETCALCTTFWNAIRNAPMQDRDSGLDDIKDWQLRAMPLPMFYHQRDNRFHRIMEPADTRWLLPVPCTDIELTLRYVGQACYAANRYGWTACTMLDGSPSVFRPLVIPRHFDAETVKRWLAVCKKSHTEFCNVIPDINDLVLIDCLSLKLSTPAHQVPYVALSYVWKKAPVELGVTPVHVSDTVLLPSLDQLPLVVKDAISITKQVGFRYLWVDKYCINQNDPIMKERQINSMNLIYGRAELSIIAGVGDETYGLTGVSVPRQPQHDMSFQHCRIVHIPPSIQYKCQASSWGQRGWTFQEEVLSRRRLYFDQDQVYFTCQEMSCNEGWQGPVESEDVKDIVDYSQISIVNMTTNNVFCILRILSSLGKESLRQIPSVEIQRRCDYMTRLTSSYSSRKLTYDSDALRAFAGIHGVFERVSPATYHVQGLPLALYTQKRTDNNRLSTFIRSMCWEHSLEDPPCRREEFPSWSWAGWTGCVYWTPALRQGVLFEMDTLNIHFGFSDGKILRLEDVIDFMSRKVTAMSHNTDPNKVEYPTSALSDELAIPQDLTSPISLRFHAAIISLSLFRFQDMDSWDGGEFANVALTTGNQFLNEKFAQLTPRVLSDGITTGRFCAVLLRIDTVPGLRCSQAHVLFVERIGDEQARRVGKMTAVDKSNIQFDIRHIKSQLVMKYLTLI